MKIAAIEYDMDSVDNAYKLTLKILEENPDISGFVCCNMSNPVGTARAVTELGSEAVIVGMDHDQEALRYLKDGVIYCLGVQDCYSIGFDTLHVAVKIADGSRPGVLFPEKTDESTHFALYSANGGNLTGTELGVLIGTKNIFDATNGNVSEEKWNSFRDDFANAKRGTLTFTINGVVDTTCYEPVPDTGWELVVMIRESVIQDQIREISEKSLAANYRQILFLLVVASVFSAILFYMLRSVAKEKLEKEKENSEAFKNLANTDSLTGVRNKHAYMETESALNGKIREGTIDKLALVACDINGLKYVNDTKGHAAGDRLIKEASFLICDIFNHGSVFRTGGDEFVVLLQGKGYDTRGEVIAAYNRQVEENIKNNDVVVSIGYSTLQPDDEQLRDLFERADHMMYDRKKELKSMGQKQENLMKLKRPGDGVNGS